MVRSQMAFNGYDVDSGRLGKNPVGIIDRLVRANIEYHPDALSNISLDLAVSHYLRHIATISGTLVSASHQMTDKMLCQPIPCWT